ncbi:catechol O-methyltransferase domain-containing protein 1 [Leucoraja erinacea]|uniref:catechol O-methyltransferase domain-containing protein 1 n=1 Tax=Leucoraja erinaceus TaxID=7782 RepID=UPI00245642B1|nr:catechol O-methyltransferase domain-containing protein 1 [Leucoraja erinacea]
MLGHREATLCGAAAGAGLLVGLWLGRKLLSRQQLRTYKSHGGANGDPLLNYLLQTSLREHPLLKKLRMRTMAQPEGIMMVACEEAQLMANLARLIHAKKVLEIGVYTGYNTMNMALAVPADGRVVACDINVDFVNIGKPFWREAEVDQKIDLRIKPAVETLDELLQAGEAETFDFAFIDADKVNYGLYYEKCLQLIRKGGVIAIDNVLWGGKVLRPGDDRDTLSIVKLNEKIHTDSRVNMSMLSIADGLTLVFKL